MDAAALIQRLFGPRAEKNTGGRKKEKRRLGRSTLDGVQVYKRVGIVDGGTLGERNEDKKRGQGSKDRTVGYSEVPVPHSFSDWVAGLVCCCLWCFAVLCTAAAD